MSPHGWTDHSQNHVGLIIIDKPEGEYNGDLIIINKPGRGNIMVVLSLLISRGKS